MTGDAGYGGGPAFCRKCGTRLAFDARARRMIECPCVPVEPGPDGLAPCLGGCGKRVGPGMKCEECAWAAVDAWLRRERA